MESVILSPTSRKQLAKNIINEPRFDDMVYLIKIALPEHVWNTITTGVLSVTSFS